MSEKTYITGDSWDIPLSIEIEKKCGEVYAPNYSGASITAAIVRESNTVATLLTERVAQTETGEEDWSKSIFLLEIPSTETDKITTISSLKLELQVTIGGKKYTFREKLKVAKGAVAGS